jgi:hypothetical protein
MSDFVNEEPDNGEELIDEEGRNPTQRAIDEDDDGGWDETNDEPAQGEGGQDIV